MANTVSLLSYANTFGDQMVTTNALVNENNTLATGNYSKKTGTLLVADPSLALQANGPVLLYNTLQSLGLGSSVTIQNNLAVTSGQVYFQNTTLGLTNAGQANINGLLIAQGPGTGLFVANTANVGGTLNVTGATALGNTLIVLKSTALGNTLTVASDATFSSNVNAQNYVNVTHDINATNITATNYLNGYSLNILGNGLVSGQLAIGGNFIINGTTVYNTNTFTINAGSSVGMNSTFNVNRGSSANATIRWLSLIHI